MTATRLTLSETQRRRRGHRFTPPIADTRAIPALYATESTPTTAKTLHLHYFVGGHDWYVAEVDRQTGEAFGLTVVNGEAEWGYFDLNALEQVNVRGGLLVVERDCWFDKAPAATVLAKRIAA